MLNKYHILIIRHKSLIRSINIYQFSSTAHFLVLGIDKIPRLMEEAEDKQSK